MATTKFKNKVKIEAEIEISQQTANTVPVLNGSKEIVSSSVTSTELGYVSGVTSAIQTQINDAQADATQALSDAAAAQADIDNHLSDAVDAHDASAISVVPTGNLAATTGQAAFVELQDDIDALDLRIDDLESLDPMEYKGNWNASTNSPSLADGIGNNGDVYRTSVAGSQDLGSGSITFAIGDKVVYNGASSVWEKWDTQDEVTSVNSQTGAVVLDTDDINEGSTNLYFTNERAQDAVGGALTDTSSIDFTYNDGANTISAVVLPAGVDHDALNNFVANEHIDHSAVSVTTAANSGLSGGGDITASRSLVVDITGTTVETSADNADEILIWDVSANARRKMTRANFLGGSIPQDTDDLAEGSTNLYFTEERVDDRVAALLTEGAGIDLTYNDGANTLTIASTITQYTDEMAQDAVGAALTDSSSIDFTYTDGSNTISAVVLPAGVDHDALSNFVANEHVDHSAVSIATASGTSGLSGGGDITTTRNIVVDITGTTALGAAPAAADEFMLWDASASALKKVTYTELTSGFSSGSAGDIEETSFASANNQASPANVTGLAFANAAVRSFKALVSVEIDATADLFESFELLGIQKGSSWDMAVSAVGDDSGITFTITNAGQVQYTSTNVAGFSSGAIKFRAITTSF
jgi:hypothetical protein